MAVTFCNVAAMPRTDIERGALTELLIGKNSGLLRPGWVARFADNRMQLKRWRESGMPEDKLDALLTELRDLLGPHIAAETEEAPPAEADGAVPNYVVRLLAGVISLENDAGITEDARDRARAQAMAWLEIGGEGRQSPPPGSSGGATGGGGA